MYTFLEANLCRHSGLQPPRPHKISLAPVMSWTLLLMLTLSTLILFKYNRYLFQIRDYMQHNWKIEKRGKRANNWVEMLCVVTLLPTLCVIVKNHNLIYFWRNRSISLYNIKLLSKCPNFHKSFYALFDNEKLLKNER